MTVENSNLYRLAYRFVRNAKARTIDSVFRVCDRYGLRKERQKLEDTVEEVRKAVQDKIGNKK